MKGSRSAWSKIGLNGTVADRCVKLGMSAPTPVQSECIPAILSGKDTIGAAPTGSGKTAAFALPILQHLSRDPYGVHTLVLSPTRELAVQIGEQFEALGAFMKPKVAILTGGVDRLAAARTLDTRPHIVVATLGRLVDLLSTSSAKVFSSLSFLVLDEADRLLAAEEALALRTIMQHLPPSSARQTLLFSATLTHTIKQLEAASMKKSTFTYQASTDYVYATVETLKQEYIFMAEQVKDCYLMYLLNEYLTERVIVFCGTIKKAEVLFRMLKKLKREAISLHKSMQQEDRVESLARFKSSTHMVLVATDVAARGLDIPKVAVVINYDLPATTEQYVHRIGRTARAGRVGFAISLVTQHDVKRFKAIQGDIAPMKEYALPERRVLQYLQELSMLRIHAEMAVESESIGIKRKDDWNDWLKTRLDATNGKAASKAAAAAPVATPSSQRKRRLDPKSAAPKKDRRLHTPSTKGKKRDKRRKKSK